MLLFVTTRGHEFGIRPFAEGSFSVDAPPILIWTYDELFRADYIPNATIIFTDFERLYAWETRLAAECCNSLRDEGLSCLNDPARVLGRYPLLRKLSRLQINPFNIYRADDDPAPQRFPVFVRAEDDHGKPLGGLLDSQAALDKHLLALVDRGVPLRGLVVIEFCGEPVAPGIWRRMGTFRIGARFHIDHAVVENKWNVKGGTAGLTPDWMFEEELTAVTENRYPLEVAEAFRASCIEYGRADHGVVNNRDIIFEINSNPTIGAAFQQRSPIRDRTFAHARRVMGESFHAIDTGTGRPMRIRPPRNVMRFRERAGTDLSPWRP